jgi:myosin-5
LFFITAGLIFCRYESTGFLDKNRDEIRDDIMNVLQVSSNSFLKEILPEVEVVVVAAGAAKAKKRMTLASHFKSQLVDLMAVLDQTLPAYVRCIKPNPEKLPHLFANKDVLGQMNCNNILETVRLRQQGWAVRRKFEYFYNKNWILDPSLGHPALMKGANHQAITAVFGTHVIRAAFILSILTIAAGALRKASVVQSVVAA